MAPLSSCLVGRTGLAWLRHEDSANEQSRQSREQGARPMVEENRLNQSQLTGVAGVHFVASYLSYLGYHSVPTTRNVQGPDLLVSNLDGSRLLSVQVKTTIWAKRTRGRGEEKEPHHYEWEIGWGSAKLNHPNLFFALVDLRNFEDLPDVFILPSRVIFAYFKGGDPTTWTRARYHPLIASVERYKNNWGVLRRALAKRV
jgi:hypothetical protein